MCPRYVPRNAPNRMRRFCGHRLACRGARATASCWRLGDTGPRRRTAGNLLDRARRTFIAPWTGDRGDHIRARQPRSSDHNQSPSATARCDARAAAAQGRAANQSARDRSASDSLKPARVGPMVAPGGHGLTSGGLGLLGGAGVLRRCDGYADDVGGVAVLVFECAGEQEGSECGAIFGAL
jgi:hypothetical protein